VASWAHSPNSIRLRELVTLALLVTGPVRVLAFAATGTSQSGAAKLSDSSSLSSQADAARDAGRLDQAVPLYRKALTLRPGWTAGWWALGTILYDQDSYADAARAFRRLLDLDPKNGTAHLMLALCDYQLDRDAIAMEHIQAAKKLGVQKDGELPHVLAYHEAMLLLRAGRYERALEALQPLAVRGVDDENVDLALGMGVLLIRPNNVAIDDPAGRQIVLRAGRAERLFLVKDFDAAKTGYSSLVEEVPAFPNVHYAYGRFLLATEDLEKGVAQFLEQMKMDSSHIRARMLIAAARYRVDSAAGLPFALEVVKLQPRYPFGHYLLGLLYFDTGDIVGATRELEIAARMVPREAQFQFALGNAYARAGRKEDAARARAAFVRLQKEEAPEGGTYDKLRTRDLDDAVMPPPKKQSGGPIKN
jgi:tetratricopeptide (TPR) repeat protein